MTIKKNPGRGYEQLDSLPLCRSLARGDGKRRTGDSLAARQLGLGSAAEVIGKGRQPLAGLVNSETRVEKSVRV